jgi:phospho-N-acetylmuramoyl-pentapeptide-transferase
MDNSDAMRIFMPAVLTFLFGIGFTPFLTYFLYKYKFWKPRANKVALDGTEAAMFNKLHEHKEVGTPRAGGILVWGSTLITAGLLSLLAEINYDAFGSLAFISREQTWLPLAALAIGSLVGLIDDYWEVRGKGGLRLRVRILVVAGVSVFCAWWFYSKLGVSAVSFPFISGPIELGILFVPFFVFIALSVYAGGVIDGIDGLSGGVYASIFAAYAGIAFFQHQSTSPHCALQFLGGLLAFLWFNIPPARFYLSETGTHGASLALTVVVFLTDLKGVGHGLMVLPIVALPLVATVFSNVLQIFWKKLFGKNYSASRRSITTSRRSAGRSTNQHALLDHSIVCAIVGMARACCSISMKKKSSSILRFCSSCAPSLRSASLSLPLRRWGSSRAALAPRSPQLPYRSSSLASYAAA